MSRPASALDAVAEIGKILAQGRDLDALAREIVERAHAALGAETTALYRRDPESGDLVVLAVSGSPGPGLGPGGRLRKGVGVAGRAAEERRPVVSADAGTLERSVLAVPLTVKDAVIGVFGADDRAGRRFSDEDIRLAEAIADHAAVALEHARRYAEAEQRRRDAEALARLARTLAEGTSDLAAVGAPIVQALLDLVEAETCALRLVRPDGSTELVALAGAAQARFAPGDVQPAGVGVVGLAARERRIVSSTDALGDSRVVLSEKLRRRMEESGASAVLAVPLEVRGAVYQDAERARSEAEAARKDAVQANRTNDEFLAVLSHELRTPLTAILGWVRILRTRTLPAARRDAALEVIERNTRAQTQLINDLLDISRIVAGKLRLEADPVEMAAVIVHSIEALAREADAKGITLDHVFDETTGPVLGDAVRLQQVVTNLVSNAIKFTPPGGHVEVRLTRVDDRARIAVRDTGAGIAADALPHIFDRFRQADSTVTRAHGGLGLGLAIVKHLVELHGGVVSAESPGAGQGSTFVVDLPAVRPVAAAPGAAPRPAKRAARLDGVRVLVVEDDEDSREMVRFVLEGQGAAVTPAVSVAEALDRFRAATPDVIVTDLGMPGADGYDLLRAVQASGAPAPPVIAVTAFAGADSRDRALAAGFAMHVPKPVEPETLIEAVVAAASPGKPRGAG